MEGTPPKTCITEEPSEWQALFVLAAQQMALPMVYGTTRALPEFQAQPEEFRREVRRQTMGQTAAQIHRTQAFAAVYQDLLIQGMAGGGQGAGLPGFVSLSGTENLWR